MNQTESPRALVVAHEPDAPGNHVTKRLVERGFSVDTHVVTPDAAAPNSADPFPDFGSYDVVALMGSTHSLTNKEEISTWIHTELDLIRAAAAADQPVLGICFGGQLIAEALGGSVEAAPVTEIGWYEIEAADGAENPVGSGPWMEWHHDRFTPPPNAVVLAENENAIQLFTVGRMAGTQFHPEIDYDHVAVWTESAGEQYLASYDQTAERILQSVKINEERNIKQCHALVDWFLDSVAFNDEAAR